MKRYCENGLCENESAVVVDVARLRPDGRMRAGKMSLCSACESAYATGRQAGEHAHPENAITIKALLEALDGAGLILTDDSLLTRELRSMGMTMGATIRPKRGKWGRS